MDKSVTKYKLGETLWTESTLNNTWDCDELSLSLETDDLIKMGAVPVTESKQIEFEEVPEYKCFAGYLAVDNDHERIEVIERNQRKIIDHLQKG